MRNVQSWTISSFKWVHDAIFASPIFEYIVKYAAKCNITSLGVKVLISIEMPNLDSLVLEINKIGDQGIKWLNKGNWRLRYLNLA